ncbi:MAG TPA: hypothetical protein VGI39_26720 [Polyangiaceae bacterium]|jgi:hypothetical protein
MNVGTFFRFAVASVTAAAVASFAVSSRADPPPEAAVQAEAHIAQGLALRRERRDAEALAEFRTAYRLVPSEHALAQVALAEDAVGLWVEAEWTLEAILAEHDDPWVEKRRAGLSGELEQLRTHLADVEMTTAPADAEVWINGARAERSAATGAFRVISGRVFVEVRRAGFESQQRVFEVVPGGRAKDRVELSPLVPPAAPVEATVRPSAPAIAAPLSSRVTREPPPVPRGRLRETLQYSSLAVAGSALLVGVVGAVERQRAALVYDDDRRCFYGNLSRAERCGGVAADVNRFNIVMTAGFVTAGVAAAVGSVLALTGPRGVRVGVGGAPRQGVQLSLSRDF